MSEAESLEALILKAHDAMQFGTVTFTLKKSRGLVTTVDTTKITDRKVTGNAQALTLVGSMLKMLADAHETGNLTFTITMQKGEAGHLMTHDFSRDNLDFETGKFR